MLLLAIVRHAETDTNVRKLWISEGDFPINEKGRSQAKLSAEVLRPFGFNVIISSDKIRAVQTAEIVSHELGIPYIKQYKILRDRFYGDAEGLTTAQIKEKFGIFMKNSLTEEIDNLNGTESIKDLEARVREALRLISEEYDGQKVIAITHGAFARMFYRLFAGNDEGIYFYNCTSAIFECSSEACNLIRGIVNVDLDDGS